jgi:hypothetical protein
MIRVTVELVSAVAPDRNRILGVAEISNVGGDQRLADYEIRLRKWAPSGGQTWRRGTLHGFPRLARGPWDLLYRALAVVVGDQNPEVRW